MRYIQTRLGAAWLPGVLFTGILLAGATAALGQTAPNQTPTAPTTSATPTNPGAAAAPPATATATASSSRRESGKPYFKKFSIGVRANVALLPLMYSGTASSSTTTPLLTTNYSGKASSDRVGGGAMIELGITKRFAIGVEYIWRLTGYQLDTELIAGADDPKTIADEREYTDISERTRAYYWDLPVLMRFGSSADSGWRHHFYYEGGAALRRTSHVSTNRTTIQADGTVVDDTNPAPVAHRLVPGAVVGAGWRFKDDFGIKVSPGVRYTYWLKNSFNTKPVQARRDQVEFVISISF